MKKIKYVFDFLQFAGVISRNSGEEAGNEQDLIKGDDICKAISAASILAKVQRDDYIDDFIKANPIYDERYKLSSKIAHNNKMKYDMGGSAVVVGLMKSLALRKAKVNAVGVVGLVENMPDGNAQRPGDIVKSYSGKTIEVLNTDAEGRLVLADALTYTEEKFKPRFIIKGRGLF